MPKLFLTNQDVLKRSSEVAKEIEDFFNPYTSLKVYAIPRGGIPAAYALMATGLRLRIVDDPSDADFFYDDIIDSGKTQSDYCEKYNIPFFALVNKLVTPSDDWYVFPWEGTVESSVEDNITRLIQFIGDDAKRGGLLETPKRVAKAWQHWFGGYNKKPSDILKVFEDGADKCDEMVVVKDIPIYSHCEHHIAPIFGTVTIAYIPNGRIVGLSKLSRLADIFARRLQVQERLTNQIADALMEELRPLGVGVVIKARHMCMESRGICQQGHHTITSALRGTFKEDSKTRQEFMGLL